MTDQPAGRAHVPRDPEKSARWWAGVLGGEVHLDVDGESVYARLTVAGVALGFHQADGERNPRGGSPVVYWAVNGLDTVRARLLAAGRTHHRGPLTASEGAVSAKPLLRIGDADDQ
ncbi:glyoxalase [Pseudofrankia sp. BMG5.36]|nr:glyoxalase [Pseudofrankia sp. BMG5.36]